METNRDWLKSEFNLPPSLIEETSNKISVGRPSKSFIDCSDKSKKRKVLQLCTNYSDSELTFAAQYKLQTSGKRIEAKILKDIINVSTEPSNIKTICNKSLCNSPIPYSPDEALAFILDNNLTKQQYINIR